LIQTGCQRAEVLAGAIALGESTDAQREAYRRHVSTCADCLHMYGGELEIERVMTRIVRARDEESWEPDIRASLRERMNTRRRFFRFGLSTLGVCFAVSIMFHAALASGLWWRIAPSLSDPLVINYDGQRVVLERRSVAAHPATTSPPKVLVTHNVVQLTRPVVASNSSPRAPMEAAKSNTTATTVAYSTGAAADNTPPWRRGGGDWRAVGARQSAPKLVNNNSQSLTISPAYSVREAAPIGGDAAINPRPPAIAYIQGAEGTTVFQVMIDERGVPTKCIITKGSGYLSLDDSVCKAAMKAHYSPRMVNGRPTPGIYQDAFTFHSNNGPGE
jgi:TonB family protein